MESPILLNSIYAAAASQLALSSPSKEQDHYRSLWYKNQVISMFRRSLSSPDPLTCASLISCVMMQTLEVSDHCLELQDAADPIHRFSILVLTIGING